MSVTLPNTITRTVYGAGVSSLTANETTLSWNSTDSTKSVLLEKQNDSTWTTVSTSATSPDTVLSEGVYRIWDGETFLSTSVVIPQTLVVTNTNDSGSGSLRAVLASARAVDTITFDASLSGSTITLASGLTISNDVTIVGLVDANGDPDITIDGDSTYRILSGSCKMTISNVVFANAGNNAIYNEDANGSSFTNCVFDSNEATDDYAGAVFLAGSNPSTDTATFTDCIFTKNESKKTMLFGWGGALTTQKLSVTATRCCFVDNVANGEYGGAVAFFSPAATLALTDCSFDGNSIATRSASTGAQDSGGAIYTVGNVTASGCTFTNNSVSNQYDGDEGGAVVILNGGTFTSCTFSGNSAKRYGGAVLSNYGGTFTSCTFTGNGVTYNSGQAGKDASQGGAIFVSGTLGVSCDTCTFTNNSTAQFGSSAATVNSSFSFKDCAFSGGTAGAYDVFVVRNGSSTSLALSGGNDIKSGVATYSHSGTPVIYNAQYNGVGGYEVKNGNAPTFSGSGFIALPPSTVVSFPATLTQTEYGAGISNFSAGEDSLSWSSIDSTRTVLLEKQNGGGWDTIDVDATSPATVSQTGVYRIWDGASFLSTSIRFPIVVTNTNDSGAGSLRAAINSATADDTITFDASLEGGTIHLLSGLSATNGATIIGLVDNDGNPAITVDGNGNYTFNSSYPVHVSNVAFNGGWGAFSSAGGFDGSTFSNCTFENMDLNVFELSNSSPTAESVSFTDCIFTSNDAADVLAIGNVNATLNGGNVLTEGLDLTNATTTVITNANYNGVGGYSAPSAGTVNIAGSGNIALPDSAVVTVAQTVTRSEFGAGLTGVSANELTISWTATDSTKSVLLEVENGADWDTVDDDATSPTTVSTDGKYRIWDGVVFLTIDVIKQMYWLVKSWGVTSNGGGSDGATTHNWTVVNLPVNPNLGEEIE